jgi:hypothetical protein
MRIVICHSSLVICHSSFVIGHSSLVICHSSLVIGHSSLVIGHLSFVIAPHLFTSPAPLPPYCEASDRGTLPKVHEICFLYHFTLSLSQDNFLKAIKTVRWAALRRGKGSLNSLLILVVTRKVLRNFTEKLPCIAINILQQSLCTPTRESHSI